MMFSRFIPKKSDNIYNLVIKSPGIHKNEKGFTEIMVWSVGDVHIMHQLK